MPPSPSSQPTSEVINPFSQAALGQPRQPRPSMPHTTVLLPPIEQQQHQRGRHASASLPPKHVPQKLPHIRLNTRNRTQQWMDGLKGLASLALVLFCVFALLPDRVQKQCYALLGVKSSILVVESVRVPVPYTYVSSPFGHRWGRQHQGVDLAAPYAAPIYAASAGTVVHSGWEAGYGKSVVIDHGHGVQTRYAHCSKLLASMGAVVAKGALIAKVGSTGHSTGPHLHFEVIVNGIRKNPAWYYRFPDPGAEQLARVSEE